MGPQRMQRKTQAQQHGKCGTVHNRRKCSEAQACTTSTPGKLCFIAATTREGLIMAHGFRARVCRCGRFLPAFAPALPPSCAADPQYLIPVCSLPTAATRWGCPSPQMLSSL